jgi:hypothetical protein
MKKLTAGIFASILGLTAMGAADAAVTSKAYVDGKVEAAVASKAEQSALTQEIADREAADQTLSGQIALKADASALAGKQDLLTGNNFKRDASETGVAGNVIASIIVDNGTVTYKTANVETSEDTAELRQRVACVESSQTTQAGQITALQTKDNELAGQIATKAEAQTVTDLATTVSGKADKSALDGYVPTATYNAGQETQDTAIEALQTKTANMATTTDVDTAKAGAVSEAAADAATKYAKIAYEGRVEALETKTADMATTTDVNTAKAGAVSEAAADAATKYAKIAYEGRVDSLEASQETQDTAITALEQFETSVKDAAKTVNNEEGTGEYALTMKLVDDGTGTGAKKPEFVWEQIVRQ